MMTFFIGAQVGPTDGLVFLFSFVAEILRWTSVMFRCMSQFKVWMNVGVVLIKDGVIIATKKNLTTIQVVILNGQNEHWDSRCDRFLLTKYMI